MNFNARSLLRYMNQTSFSQPFPKVQLILIDSFESGQLQDRWQLGNSNAIKINYNPLNVHSGNRSMEVVALPGKEAGDMARIFFQQVMIKFMLDGTASLILTLTRAT